MEMNTHTLYPSMMENSRLLIVDFDITRYHSFDLFRYLLLDKEWFKRMDSRFIPMIRQRELIDQVDQYRKAAWSAVPRVFFKPDENDSELNNIDWMIQQSQRMFSSDLSKITPTDVSSRFDIVFERNNITGVWVHQPNDSHIPSFSDKVQQYELKQILDYKELSKIIVNLGLNAVMLSSVDLAVLISYCIHQDLNYKQPVSFIVANYRYNYSDKTMRQLQSMNMLELLYKDEFGIFDPFTGIAYRNRLQKLEEDSNG